MSMFDIAIAYMFPANFILSDYGKETALFYKRKLDPTSEYSVSSEMNSLILILCIYIKQVSIHTLLLTY
jgi:hypothetical protein